jgi:DNA-binding transcriptional ArsR family regulator
MSEDQNARLLVFFSALSDANRLKIVGLLAQGDYSVEELAEMLELRPSTISHHLSKLSKVGLVSARAESYYNVYHLNTSSLEEMARTILTEETLPELAAGVDMNAYDRKVVKDFTRSDGRLKTLPAQRKKLEAVLRYVVKAFQPGKHYSEPQVNDALARFHNDTASLRRELIAAKMMERDSAGTDYWRVV